MYAECHTEMCSNNDVIAARLTRSGTLMAGRLQSRLMPQLQSSQHRAQTHRAHGDLTLHCNGKTNLFEDLALECGESVDNRLY